MTDAELRQVEEWATSMSICTERGADVILTLVAEVRRLRAELDATLCEGSP